MTVHQDSVGAARIDHDSLFIGGEWRAPLGHERIEVLNASTSAPLGSVPAASPADVDAAVAAARQAFDAPDGWSRWDPARRAEAMEALAAAVAARGQDTARLVSQQNGMPIAMSGQLEAMMPAVMLGYFAGLARGLGEEERRPGMMGGVSLVRRQAKGVVAAIVPWNVPQALTFVKVAPALAAGCTVVIKPSPETVLDSMVLAEAVQEAGLPAGVISIVPGGSELGSYLVSHPGVDKVAFTGSTATGRAVALECARLLRPVTLELGGKSAAIVLDDAQLEANLEAFFGATMPANGQICWASTRVLLPRSRYRELTDLITDLVRTRPVGDALDPATQIGPLVSSRQRDRVERYVTQGVADGARLTTGGARPDGLDTGWFVAPAVLADVEPSAILAQEEVFGPVLALLPYADEAEAVRLANDSSYGLGGSVWTSDVEHGVQVARQIETGSVGINSYVPDLGAPVGGRKDSGLGYECGPEGLAEYLTYQSIFIP